MNGARGLAAGALALAAHGPRRRRRAGGRRSRHHGRSGREDRAGLQLRRRQARAGLGPERGRRPGQQRRHRPHRDRHHPPEGVRAEPEGPGDHRRQPVLHVGRARQRDAVHPHDRRRRAGQVPALLRQLLRPARLRGDPRPLRRHRVLHRLPAARRPGRRQRLQGRDRLARGPRPRLHVGDRRHARRRRLGQRQERHDRQVLRRHVRQRRRRHGRRRPDDDRPDLGDLRLVRLLAHGRHPGEHPLPAQPGQQHHRRAVGGHARRAAARSPDARAPRCSTT